MSTTTIVVPCHNEAQRLHVAKFRQFAAQHRNIHFLFVNDGSRDATLSMLQQLAGQDPNCFDVLDLVQNYGKAEAVRRGILHAAQGNSDYVGFWDADLATPLEAIPQLIDVLDRREEIELAFGVRMQLLGHAILRQPLRRLIGRLFVRAASQVLGSRFNDTQCGAKLFRVSLEVLAAFSQPFDSRWIFDVELLARLVRMRRDASRPSIRDAIFEFPLEHWEDVAGSKLKRGDFLKAARELTSIWWRYLRPAAPSFIPAALEIEAPKQQPVAPRKAA